MNAYMVTWRKKGFALPFLIDFDNEGLAVRASVALSEIGRLDVAVTLTEYEEDAALKQRIFERIQSRMRELPVFA